MAEAGKVRQQLLELRSAIIDKPQVQQEKEKTVKQRDAIKFTLTPPESYQYPKSQHAATLKAEFEEPILGPWREAARKKAEEAERHASSQTRAFNRRKTGASGARRFFFSALLIIAALGVLALGGFLSYKVGVWSWNQSITSFMNSSYLGDSGFEYETAVGIHMLSLCLALLGLGIIPFFIAFGIDNDEWSGMYFRVFLLIMAGAMWLFSLVSLYVSLTSFFALSENFFEGFLYLFSYLLFIPKAFFMWIYVVPFLLVPTAALVAVGFAVFGCARFIAEMAERQADEKRFASNSTKVDARNAYTKAYDQEMAKAPVVDYSSLYNSKKYKDALVRDQEEDKREFTRYKNNYNAQLGKHKELISQYNYAISQYDQMITKCNQTINNATFLHPTQRNVQTINTILYYFEMRHAQTIHDALNDWETDKHRMRMEQELAAIRRETTIRLEQGLDQITREMQAMRSDVVSGISSVNANLARQTRQIEKSLDSLREENARNADRIADNTGRTASNTGYLAEVARRYN